MVYETFGLGGHGAMSKRPKTTPRPGARRPTPPGRAGAEAALAQARQLLRQGHAPQAEGLLRQLLARQPGDHQALHMLGLIAHQAGRLEQARDLLDQALQGNRRDPQLWLNFGNILNSLRAFEQAEAAFRKALRLRACIPGGNSGLGMSHSGRGNHREASVCYRREIGCNPVFAAGHANLGLACLELGEEEEALRVLEGAARRFPDNVQVLEALGAAAVRGGDTGGGIDAYRRAATLAPRRLEALRNMATAALIAGRLAEAEEALVALDGRRSGDPQGALLWVKLHLARGEIEHALEAVEAAGLEALRRNLYRGYVLAQAGRFAEAGACYRAVLDEDPGLGAALNALAMISDGDGDQARLIGELERMLIAGEPEAGERIGLDFSLGRLYDRAGLYDQAFSHYAAGNRRKGLRFDRAAYADRTDRLIETFGRGYFEGRSGLGSDSERPLFVLGTPRSGTTLTEQILASHSQVFGAGELSHFGLLIHQLEDKSVATS
ncbi:MAG: hypothetical protein C3L25_13190 [Candidatus Sedimenticola endophacoides]|uniref:Uncharacterized protein n=1 Tax=Candidatus Sedimenticola endophacoides TaxID=2548426 RepID=A0A6N4DP05_9GAMM|nr:MAG: hypothetical protein C3L26_13285 [Candidatus Sedimenticola endophacoides]PUD98966.1 MAG: hypothetical protein C3L24_11690 [Candidatus Sedimenticola endophacoides]PUE00856.1 MAG: hypothetical protein C3L25_13190 [Candidatus Sedimenticola endophacoides]